LVPGQELVRLAGCGAVAKRGEPIRGGVTACRAIRRLGRTMGSCCCFGRNYFARK
jgi:hypothetical protein